MNERGLALAGTAARWAGGARLAKLTTPSDNIRIALSHSVYDEDMGRFEEIVRFLLEKRTPITPSEFLSHYRNGSSKKIEGHSFLYTFDDGLKSSYDAAMNVLSPLGVKAAFFVPTAILELETPKEMKRFAWERIYHCNRPIESMRPEEYLMMGADEILALHRDGHAVFPHTYSHVNISEIRTPADVECELHRPQQVLEELLSTPVDAFAFPVGTERVLSAYSYLHVSRIYAFCFSALMGANTGRTDPLLFHRDSIHPWYSLDHVRNILDGVYDPYYKLKARRLRRSVDIAPRRNGTAGSAHKLLKQAAASSSGVASPARARFVTAVADQFNAAGINYVVLHGSESSNARDTDVDVAVDRAGSGVVDTLVRTGVFGQLVQCLHYADPASRYYVVAAHEPGRRYREIDVVCDPAGIGKDGPAVRVALEEATVHDGVRVPTPAAQTMYLAVKKARKRQHGREARATLLRSFERDPDGARVLLGQHFGNAGRTLAEALDAGAVELQPQLEALRRALNRRRRSPRALAARSVSSPPRIARRIASPTGFLLVLAGPDGTGKSTLAGALERAALGPFRRTQRLHLRPGVLPRPGRLLRRPAPDTTAPHSQSVAGWPGSALRVTYLWLDTFLGWFPKIAIPRRRSTLVLLERGWIDLSVDPRRYRLTSGKLAYRLARFLPRADLLIHLEAPAEIVRARKPELSADEIRRQFEAWRSEAAAGAARFGSIDSSGSEDDVCRGALDAIDAVLASRQREFGSCELALRCLGGLKAHGRRFTVISAPRGPVLRGPRWLLPAGFGAPGPIGMQLYRPARSRHRAGALALEALQRSGLSSFGRAITLDPDRGVGPLIADALGIDRVDLAAAVTGDRRRGDRALLSVWQNRRVVAFAKVARQEADKLEHEFAVLRAFEHCKLETLHVPDAIGLFHWEDSAVLLLRPFDVRHRADRALGPAEIAGLAELASLSEPLAAVIGTDPELVPVHGDFAPWNSSPWSPSAFALWDWEEARLGLPLEDLFHWRMQRLLRFGHGNAEDIVAGAIEPDFEVKAICARLGIDTSAAPAALRTCLEKTLRAPSMEVAPPPTRQLLKSAVARLAEATA